MLRDNERKRVPHRILVVDDEPENQLLIRMILQGEGYDVEVKDNGLDALAAARESPFSVIVLDVMMPDLNGFEVYAQLRADECTRELPVIMLTALAQRKDYEQAAQLGVKDYVTKPFEPDELLSRVRAALGRRAAEGDRVDAQSSGGG